MDIENKEDDELEIEIEGEEEEVVEEKPKAKAENQDDTSGDDDDDDEGEAKEYSERVQKRIKRLTYEKNEERRLREASDREKDEAVRVAQTAYEELKRARGQVDQGQGALYKEVDDRITAQIAAVRRELKDAYDEGDSEKIVEAQSKMAELSAEKARLSGYRPKNSPEKTDTPVHSPPQQQAQRRQPTTAAKEWAEKNTWFNTDSKMTAYAFGVHHDLVEKEGVQPDSEEYYRQIDKEMRRMFPTKFGEKSEPVDTPATVVAAPSRQAGKKPRTVRLTQTQINLAKRLGITNEQYAKELIKNKDSNDV